MGMFAEGEKRLLRTVTGGGQAVGAEPYPGEKSNQGYVLTGLVTERIQRGTEQGSADRLHIRRPPHTFRPVQRRGMSVLRLMARALSYRPGRHGSLALEDDQAMNEISFAAPEIAASRQRSIPTNEGGMWETLRLDAERAAAGEEMLRGF